LTSVALPLVLLKAWIAIVDVKAWIAIVDARCTNVPD